MKTIDVLRVCRMAPAFAAAVLATACATPPTGYGAAAQQANEEAILRQQVANQDPVADNRGMYLSMIREMQGKGLYFASLAHVDAFVQKFGSAPDVELLRAHGLREAGQSAESEAVYKTLLTSSSGAAAAQGLGLLAGARGDFGAAVGALRDAARRDPTNPMIVSDLGYALLRQGDLARARLSVVQAAELAPTNPKIIGNLALFLLVSGDSVRADAVMKRADLTPEARAAVIKLAGGILSGAAISAVAPAAIAVPVESAPSVAVSRVEMGRFAEGTASTPTDIVPTPARRPVVAAVPVPASGTRPMQTLLDRFGNPAP